MKYNNRRSDYSRYDNFNPLVGGSRQPKKSYIQRYEEENNINYGRNHNNFGNEGRLRIRNNGRRNEFRPGQRGYDIISGQARNHGRGNQSRFDNNDSDARQWGFENGRREEQNYRRDNQQSFNQVRNEIYGGANKRNSAFNKGYDDENLYGYDNDVSRREKNISKGRDYGRIRSSTAELYSNDVNVNQAKETGIRNTGNSCYM